MNEYQTQPYTEKKIIEALNQMRLTKTLGPDGLPAAFYWKHWPLVNIAPLNHTYIALVANNAKLRKVTEFRPISLCNFIYRICKTIANRLKTILHAIIDSS